MDPHLKEVLLLGTGRRSFAPQQLHPAIAQRLDGQLATEKQVLQALSYAIYLDAVGQTLPSLIMEEVIEREPEVVERPTTPPAISGLLDDILGLDHRYALRWLKKWLQLIDDREEKLPPASVVKLIPTITGLNKNTQQQAARVLGQTTRTLFEQHGLWTAKGEASTEWSETNWHFGKADERQEYWAVLHKTDATEAITLLKADWAQENIRNKWAFLKSIAADLQEADRAFLVLLYETAFGDKILSTKTARACKRLIVGLLIRLQHQPLLSELKMQLQRYIKAEKENSLLGIFSGKRKKNLRLPKQEDAFWSGAYLQATYGLEQKNEALDRFDYDSYFWFAQFLELLPLGFIMQLLDRDPAETVDYLLKTPAFITQIGGRSVAIFEQTLLEKAINEKEDLLIHTLTNGLDWKTTQVLLPYMSGPLFEHYVTKQQLFQNTGVFEERGAPSDELWSMAFSKMVTDHWIRLFEVRTDPYQIPAHHFVSHFNPAAWPYLQEKTAAMTHQLGLSSWQKYIVDPLEANLRIRHKIIQYKK